MGKKGKWTLFKEFKEQELTELRANRTRAIEGADADIRALERLINDMKNFNGKADKTN